MAVRSFTVTVQNHTGQEWRLQLVDLDGGVWETAPPEVIPAGETRWFRAESSGVMTGVEGVVHYTGGETISMHFNNPYAGGNQFGASSNFGDRTAYDLLWGDPGGADAQITLEIRPRRPRWGAAHQIVGENSVVVTGVPGLAAVSSASDRLHLVWAGSDGGIGTMFWNDGWGAPVQIVSSGSVGGGIAAASRFPEHTDLFFVNRRQGIEILSWYDQDRRWGPPVELIPGGSAAPNGGVAAVSRNTEHLDLFWAAADGSIWIKSWLGLWEPPVSLVRPGSVAPGGGIAAVSRNTEHLDVYWIHGDGSIWIKSWLGHWTDPEVLISNANAVGGLTAATRYADHVDLFWCGDDGGVGIRSWLGGWHPPAQVVHSGSTAGGGLAAASRFTEHLDLYWVGGDGGIGTMTWGP